MAAMVEIKHPSTLDLEQMISDLMGKPGWGMVRPVLMDQEPVLGLQAKNSMQHTFTSVPNSGHWEAMLSTRQTPASGI